ncbi:MAG: hypothetical protein US25_C0072G0006 [Candidatus Moranbacteria bacterium GW2011_GWE1_36_7]|nr:MAG: hypothetical protein UR99_C0045G0005 [Candidatus Moranbacteria bacterium GW2011_GWD2_36_12]KKQ11806.1 MAG: hypothetical protein US25_C0072G0006 [Candidatus Moranbacteria bacterium GW2011_GWE1_36_7]
MRILIKKNADRELRRVLRETERKERLKAQTFARRTTYVNPGALRSGAKQGVILSFVVFNNYCPV